MLIINHDSVFIGVWRSIDILFRVISSYIFMWIGCFGTDMETELLLLISWVFEFFFLISMFIRF